MFKIFIKAFSLFFAGILMSMTMTGCSDSMTDESLQSVIVNPIRTTMASGIEVQYSAKGIYLDKVVSLDENVVWKSSDSSVATITQSGLVTTVSPGSVEITATFDAKIGTSKLTVTTAGITEIVITPADTTVIVGKTGTYKAIATFSDGDTYNVSRQATWVSVDPSTVSIVTSGKNAGDAHALKVGNTTITATLGAITSNTATITVISPTLVSLEIIGATAANVVETIQLTALATYSNGMDLDVTDEVLWNSFDQDLIGSDIIHVDKGKIWADEEGYAEISARFSDVSDENMVARHPVRFVETSVAITKLDIHYADASCSKDTKITDTNVDIPLVDDVSYNDDCSDSRDDECMPTTLTPGAYYATACATFEDGSVLYVGDVSGWFSSDQESAYINGIQGSFIFGRNYAQGVIIKAQYAGVEASFKVNVTDAITRTLVSIELVPRDHSDDSTNHASGTFAGGTLSIPEGLDHWVTAMGTYSNGDEEDINSNVFYNSNNTTAAYMNETKNSTINARNPGDAVISATWQGVTGSINVHVVELESITIKNNSDGNDPIVTPLNLSTKRNNGIYPREVYLASYGNYAEGLGEIYINANVLWTSQDRKTATLTALHDGTLVDGSWIEAKAKGDTTATAKLSGISGVIDVHVIEE